MSWKPEVEELHRREELARRMGGEERVQRQHDAGRLTVRERIARLADPQSFHEIGALTGVPVYEGERLVEIRPSNFVAGTVRLAGRRVVLGGDDFTVRGGAADGTVGYKAGYAERMALELRLPIVRLVDGTGGGGSVKSLETTRRTYVPANPAMEIMTELMSTVPVVAAALGPVAGLGAARVVFSHFSVMPRASAQLFVAGPPVVRRGIGQDVDKETLGGSSIHTRESGAVDNEVESEDEAFAQIRRFLSYLPASVYELPPVEACDDPVSRREEELLQIVPRSRRQPHDVRRIIALVCDRGDFFEISPRFGRSVVTGLARLAGRPVGVIGNDPKRLGGAVDGDAADKLTRFTDLCDTFHLPIVNFVDNPGFLIGVAGEKAGTIRRGARAISAVYQASVPWCSILVRRVFGVAGAAHGNHSKLNLRYAWPSGEWGSLPIEGGVEAAYKRELEAAADPDALRRELEAKLGAMRSPFRTAEIFGVEEIIDPRDTRPLLCEWVETAYRLLPAEVGVKRRGMRP
ncbi:MAG TPA: carboxyl transferase domain-containing protein [Myxococcota bacterium]|nr:carboxyl transferase domain-containing protein [Myxococcota bacterium]